MFDLTAKWPLGLNSRNWAIYGVVVVVLLAGLALLDGWTAQGVAQLPDQWRIPFERITDYGLSDWVLYPSLAVFVVARLLAMHGRFKQTAEQISLLSGFIFVGVGLPGLVSNLIKRLVGRGRPQVFEDLGAFDFQILGNDWLHQSFPSGHATTAVGLAFIAGFLWPRTFLPLLAIGALVALSRFMIGMHYPSDVVAGAILGMLGAYGVRNVFAWRGWLFQVQPDGSTVRRPRAIA